MTGAAAPRRSRPIAVLAAWAVLAVCLPIAGSLAAPAPPAAAAAGDPFTFGLAAYFWPEAATSVKVSIETRPDERAPWVEHADSPFALPDDETKTFVEVGEGDHIRLSRLGDVEPYHLSWTCGARGIQSTDGGRTIEITTDNLRNPSLRNCYQNNQAAGVELTAWLAPGTTDPGVPLDFEVTRPLVHQVGTNVDRYQVPVDSTVEVLAPISKWDDRVLRSTITNTTPGLLSRHQCFEESEGGRVQVRPEVEGEWAEGHAFIEPRGGYFVSCDFELYEPEPELVGAAAITSVLADKDGNSTVEIGWGAVDGTERDFEVWRDGTHLTTLPSSARSYTDSISDGRLHEYLVVAGLTSGRTVIGAPSLRIPDDRRECSILWTGSLTSEWIQPRNWAPFAFQAADPGSVRIPGPDDHACIDVERSLPVRTGGAAMTSVGQVTSALQNVNALTVGNPGTLHVLGDLDLPAISFASGTLHVEGSASLTSTSIPGVTFYRGALVIDGDIDVAGAFQTGTVSRITISGDGTLRVAELLIADDTSIDGRGDFVIEAGSVLSSGESKLGWMADDPILRTDSLTVLGSLEVVWGLSGLDELSVTVEQGSTAQFIDVVELRDSRTWTGANLVLRGGLELGQEIQGFAGSLTIGDPNAWVASYWDDPSGSIGSLTSIDELIVTGGGEVHSTGALTTARLTLENGTLVPVGALTVTERVHLAGKARLAGTVPWTLDSAVLRVTGEANSVEGGLTLDGGARLDLAEATGTPATFGELTVDSLTVTKAASVQVGVNRNGPGRVIAGALTLDGAFTAVVAEQLDDDLHLPIATATERFAHTGTTNLATIDGGHPSLLDGVAIQVATDGLWLDTQKTTEPPAPCATPPQVGALAVTGCWEEQPGGRYRTSVERADDSGVDATIGGVKVRPSANVDLFLDSRTGTLDARVRGSGAVGTVSVSTQIFDTRGATIALPLGTVPVGNWNLVDPAGPGLALAVTDLVGLPVSGTARLTYRNGLRLTAGLTLPSVFDVVPLLDVPVSIEGIAGDQLRITGITTALLDLAEVVGVTLRWLEGSTWSISTSSLSLVKVTGSVTFDPDDEWGGTLTVRSLKIGELLEVPDFTLVAGRQAEHETWTYTNDERDQVLREVSAVFEDRKLVGGSLILGDEPGADQRPPVASWGGLIEIDGLGFGYDPAQKRWDLAGHLTHPDISFTGHIVIDGGKVVGGGVTFAGLDIAGLVDVDLAVTFEPGSAYGVALTATGPGGGGISGSGSLTLDAGVLRAAQLDLDSLHLGELASIENVSFSYSDATGDGTKLSDWNIGGSLVRHAGDPGSSTSVQGRLSYENGAVQSGHLVIEQLPLGFAELTRFRLDHDATGTTGTTWSISGEVRTPSVDSVSTTGSLDGSLTLDDGRIVAGSLSIPHLPVAELAVVSNLDLRYFSNRDHSGFTGSGSIRAANQAAGTKADVEIRTEGGAVTYARVQTAKLAFGGFSVLDGFSLLYEREGQLTAQCDRLPGAPTDPAQYWALSATRAEGTTTTSVAGCLVRQGGRTVAGRVSLGDLGVGELFTVEDLEVSFASSTVIPVQQSRPAMPAVTVGVPQTTWSLDGDFRVGTGAASSVTGELVLFDGSVRSAHLALGAIPLTNLVRIDHLRLDLDAGTPWDLTEDSTFAISGQASHEKGSTSLDGSVDMARVSGRVRAIEVLVTGVPFGPVTLDQLGFAYDGTDTDTRSWSFTGALSTGGGTLAELGGSLVLEDGQVQSGTLEIPHLSVGDLASVEDASFSYQRLTDRERWSGQGTVSSADPPSSAQVILEVNTDGKLVAGRIDIGKLSWGGLFTIEQFRLIGAPTTGPRPEFRWDLTAALRLGKGNTSAVSGWLLLEDGRARSGAIHMSNLAIAELATIQTLDLTVTSGQGDKGTALAASLVVRVGDAPATTTTTGSLELTDGALSSASLRLGQVRFGELATLDDLRLAWAQGVSWSAHATVTHEGGTTSLGGSLTFRDGTVDSGRLEVSNLQFGPMNLTSFVLDANSPTVGQVCGVAEPPAVAGQRSWALQASVRTGDGDTTSLGGRLRLDGRRVTDGVLCVQNLQVADIANIDSATLAYSSVDGTDRWSGAATVNNNAQPWAPFTGSFEFAISDRTLQTARLTASGLNIGGTLRLTGVDFAYDRDGDATAWHLSATLARQGEAPGTIGGALEIVDGTIVGGSLQISSIPFGDAFTIDQLDLTFMGRRSVSATPMLGEDTPFPTPGSTSCAAPPAATPAEAPGVAGTRESYFSAGATITSNGETFTVRGAAAFADGKITAFDVAASCIPIGDLVTIEDFRLAYSTGSSFRFGGRLRINDEGVAPTVYGRVHFQGGRVDEGAIRIGGMPLGPVVLESFDLTIGATNGNTSTWAAGLTVRTDDGDLLGGSGSLTFSDGRLVGGSLSIPEIPLAGLVKVRNLGLTVDGSQPGRTALAGSAEVTTADGGGSMAASITFEEGRVTEGSFHAEAVKLFDLVPVAGFGFSYSSTDNRWSGQMSTAGSGSGFPSLILGVEFANGKLVSGVFGFDGNGDGVVDGPVGGEAPTSGNGMFGDIPLKALFVRYCAVGSTAQFCEDGSAGSWEGRIAIELPTEAAPGIAAGMRVRNGKLVRAEFEVSGLNIPVFTGVFLNAIRGHVEADPWIAFGGGIGLTVGAPSLTVAVVDANFAFDNGPGSPPEYKIFSLTGNVDVFPGNPLGIKIEGQVAIEMQTWGYLGVSATVNVELIRKVLAVEGYASGQIFNASAANVTITNPRTGNPLTGAVVQMAGGVKAKILKINVAGADFVINTIGATACAYVQIPLVGRVQIGAGFYWSGGTRITCDMGRYRINVPGTIAGGAQADQLPAADRSTDGRSAEGRDLTVVPVYPTATVVDTFQIDPGEDLLGVDVQSRGTPRVTLISPNGTRYVGNPDGPDDEDISDGVVMTTGDREAMFLISSPPAGTWQVEAAGFSPQIDEVGSYLKLPPVAVGGSVNRTGDGAFQLIYDFDDIDGQEVIFVEREPGGGKEILGGIGTATRPVPGGRTNGAGKLAADTATRATGDDGVPFLRATPATPGSGTLEFRPNGTGAGGDREIVAMVMQDGLPRAEVVLGTYTAPPATPAGAPQAMTVVEQPGGAHVTWQPPAHDGGRRITSYRVMADTGMSVSVDHATGAVDLPIPAMAPGRVVPVTVQAWTGLGWGEAATMSFTSTQTTPFTALTYADPGPEDPDPEDPDPENPDPENPDPEVPGPVDPGDPGTPGAPGTPGTPGTPGSPAASAGGGSGGTPEAPAAPGTRRGGTGTDAGTGTSGSDGGTTADHAGDETSPDDTSTGRADDSTDRSADPARSRDDETAAVQRSDDDSDGGGMGGVGYLLILLSSVALAVAIGFAVRRPRSGGS